MKGKLTGIFLLLCLVVPIATTFTFLHFHKKQIRREVKRKIIAGIDKNELILLRLSEIESQTKLNWKHSKEFEFNQQMYDIVETEVKGDTIYYWCMRDTKETKLDEQLDNLLAYTLGKDPIQKTGQNNLLNFYKSLYCEQLPDWHYYLCQTEQIKVDYRFIHQTVSWSPPDPPPEIG